MSSWDFMPIDPFDVASAVGDSDWDALRRLIRKVADEERRAGDERLAHVLEQAMDPRRGDQEDEDRKSEHVEVNFSGREAAQIAASRGEPVVSGARGEVRRELHAYLVHGAAWVAVGPDVADDPGPRRRARRSTGMAGRLGRRG